MNTVLTVDQREKSSQSGDSFNALRVEKNRRFVSKGEAVNKETA